MDMTTPTAIAQYNAQERVLCYHGSHVYEAKVLKTKNFDEPSPTTGEVGPHYLVHYKGWKQTCVFFSSEVMVRLVIEHIQSMIFSPGLSCLPSRFFHIFYFCDEGLTTITFFPPQMGRMGF